MQKWRIGIVVLLGLISWNAFAGGTWAPLLHAPPAGLNNSLLLSDGTVIAGDGGNHWYKLTPDSTGSYVKGTWTTLASTFYTRLFFSSQILTNGNLYVMGGEYGTGTYDAELYNSVSDSWRQLGQTPNQTHISDAISKMLPNGNVLQGSTGGTCWIYNVATGAWQNAAAAAHTQNEADWVTLSNGCILSVDNFNVNSEHYVPSLNQWIADANTPQDLYGYGGELGPGFLLPDGRVFFIGASVHTAIYTPGATVTSAGSWVAGPDMVFGGSSLGAVDAPAAMLPNGKILMCIGPTNGFNGPTSFYEYDYTVNSFTQVNGPTGLTLSSAPFVMTFLDLPDGNVLFISGQGSRNLYVYTPDGTPLAQGQPTISNITQNANGTFHLIGTGLNGISGGAGYGDDWQMDSNYPLIRMTNETTGVVYYARTFGWKTGVMTGTNLVTTEFSLPANLPAGNYSLVTVANGISSDPVEFTNAPIAAPTGLAATIGNTQLGLSWNPVDGALGYILKRLNTNGSPYYSLSVNQTGTNYTDTGLTNGLPYYYVVVAYGTNGVSLNSSQLVTSPVGPPPVPGGLVAYPSETQQLTLSWFTSYGATSYFVKRATNSGGPYTTLSNPTKTNYVDSAVTVGTTYYYVVSAFGPHGESSNTVEVSAVPDVQNIFLDFNVAGQYASNFFQWNDASGVNGNNFDFLESASIGVANTRGISVYRNTDTTATYKIGSWNFSTPTANLTMSTMIKANAQNTTDKIQMGITSSNANGLNNNGTIAFETFRFQPISNSVWSLREQYRDNNSLTESNLGNVTIISGHWYKFVISMTNTSAAGNYFAGCSLFDYGTTGLTPGSNLVTFSTLRNNTSQDIATKTKVWPAFRAYQDAGVTAWDNFLVYKNNSKPLLTFALTNKTVTYGTTATFTALADGPGTLVYTWRTNNTVVPGAITSTYTTPPVDLSYTNVSVTIANANGSIASSSTVTIFGGPPDAPTNVVATAGDVQTALTWDALTNATSYNVKRSTTDGGPYVIVGNSVNTQFTDTNVTAGTTYYYVVSGLNSYGEGSNSVSASSTPFLLAPAVPANLTATAGPGLISLTWTASLDAANYNVKRSTTNGGPYAIVGVASTTNYSDAGLLSGVPYYYVVSATNATGEGANSIQATATVISVPPVQLSIATQSMANGQFTLQFPGVDGYPYIIETSSNLADWFPYVTNTSTNGVFIFTDTNVSDAARFYRVKE